MVGRLTATFLFCMIISASGYCQAPPSDKQIKVAKGQVSGIDWVGDKLVVRSREFDHTDEITFIVPHGSKITKGTRTISFSDMHISDEVTVEYYYDSFVGLKTVHIMVRQ